MMLSHAIKNGLCNNLTLTRCMMHVLFLLWMFFMVLMLLLNERNVVDAKRNSILENEEGSEPRRLYIPVQPSTEAATKFPRFLIFIYHHFPCYLLQHQFPQYDCTEEEKGYWLSYAQEHGSSLSHAYSSYSSEAAARYHSFYYNENLSIFDKFKNTHDVLVVGPRSEAKYPNDRRLDDKDFSGSDNYALWLKKYFPIIPTEENGQISSVDALFECMTEDANNDVCQQEFFDLKNEGKTHLRYVVNSTIQWFNEKRDYQSTKPFVAVVNLPGLHPSMIKSSHKQRRLNAEKDISLPKEQIKNYFASIDSAIKDILQAINFADRSDVITVTTADSMYPESQSLISDIISLDENHNKEYKPEMLQKWSQLSQTPFIITGPYIASGRVIQTPFSIKHAMETLVMLSKTEVSQIPVLMQTQSEDALLLPFLNQNAAQYDFLTLSPGKFVEIYPDHHSPLNAMSESIKVDWRVIITHLRSIDTLVEAICIYWPKKQRLSRHFFDLSGSDLLESPVHDEIWMVVWNEAIVSMETDWKTICEASLPSTTDGNDNGDEDNHNSSSNNNNNNDNSNENSNEEKTNNQKGVPPTTPSPTPPYDLSPNGMATSSPTIFHIPEKEEIKEMVMTPEFLFGIVSGILFLVLVIIPIGICCCCKSCCSKENNAPKTTRGRFSRISPTADNSTTTDNSTSNQLSIVTDNELDGIQLTDISVSANSLPSSLPESLSYISRCASEFIKNPKVSPTEFENRWGSNNTSEISNGGNNLEFWGLSLKLVPSIDTLKSILEPLHVELLASGTVSGVMKAYFFSRDKDTMELSQMEISIVIQTGRMSVVFKPSSRQIKERTFIEGIQFVLNENLSR